LGLSGLGGPTEGGVKGRNTPTAGGAAIVGDPADSAKASGLRYVSDNVSGLSRQRHGQNGFRYLDPNGQVIRDTRVLGRIKSLVVPPAWTDVWICADPNGHLQATGRDARHRKQHRYHPRWREVRDETKYNRMIAFAKALPRIRNRISRDLRLKGLPRNKVLATIVRLLETSLIRVGNDEYARENESFGLTTMRNRHVDVNGSTLHFRFRGKAGKWHEVDVRNSRLAKIVRSCQDLPGQELFQHIDEEGQPHDIHSGDVNDYLRDISGSDFTAKDFRTWAGTVLGATALAEFKECRSQKRAKKNFVQAVEKVAERLGNTPAVCRKCYMHPHVIDAYLEGNLAASLKSGGEFNSSLRQEETAVLRLLQQRKKVSKQREKPLPELLDRSIQKQQRRR
jgi:DNA topoisomerase-1